MKGFEAMSRLYRRPDEAGGTYYVDMTRHGKRVRRSLETSVLKIAKQRRDAIVAEKVELTWGVSDKDITPSEFWSRYEAWAQLHKAKASIQREDIIFRQFVTFLSPKTLSAVSKQDVERLKVHLKKDRGMKNVSVNGGLRHMNTLYNYARKLGLYSRHNPFEGFERLPVEEKPVKFLSGEEIDALLAEAKKHSERIHLFISLATYAGMRSREVANCRWEWIDFDQGIITVQGADDGSFSTKGKRHRTIPLHSKLRAILEPHRKQEGYIVNENSKPGVWRLRYEPKKAFKNVAKLAGVPWCTPHVLRHTFASQLVISGVSIYKVSRWLGHADVKTTMIYAHLAPVDDDINRF